MTDFEDHIKALEEVAGRVREQEKESSQSLLVQSKIRFSATLYACLHKLI